MLPLLLFFLSSQHPDLDTGLCQISYGLWYTILKFIFNNCTIYTLLNVTLFISSQDADLDTSLCQISYGL